MFVREVARIDDPHFVSGQVAGRRARRLIDAPDAAFAGFLGDANIVDQDVQGHLD